MGYRLVPKLVTLNDPERRKTVLIVRHVTEFDRWEGRLRHSGWTYKVWCRISSSQVYFGQNWLT